MLRKSDAIVSNVASRVRKTTHDYGVEIPNKFYEHVLLHAVDALITSEISDSILRDRLGNHF